MRKILFFVFLLISVVGFSQNPTNYQYRTVRERLLAMMVDSSFHLPRYNGVPSGLRVGMSPMDGALAIDTANGNLYFYHNTAWKLFTSKVDSVTFNPSQSVDTVLYWVDGVRFVAGVIDARCGLIQPGTVVYDSLLSFTVSPSIHRDCCDGVRYTTDLEHITLSAAHATLDRIDVIALEGDDVVVVEGTPAATPAKPQLSQCQTELTFIYVPAASTVPGGETVIDTVIIYDQNLPEWVVSGSFVTFDADNTTSPFHLTKAVSVGAITATSNLKFTSNQNEYQKQDYNSLRLYIKLKAAFASNCRLNLVWFNNGVAVSSTVVLQQGVYGFSRTNTSTYQEIIIPMSDWNFGANTTFDAFWIQSTGINASGYYVDWITLTGGIPQQQITHPNSFGVVTTQSGTATSTQPNDALNIIGAGGITTSATGKTVTITASGGGGETLQQTFDLETANAVMDKNNTMTLRHNTTFKVSAKTNGYFEFKDDSSAVPRIMRLATSPIEKFVVIQGHNNTINGLPREQLVIYNPVDTSAIGQAMIGFKTDPAWAGGGADTIISWVGGTSGTYNVGGGIRRNTAYIENDSNGVAFLANSASLGSVRSYVGPFTLDASLRMEVETDTVTINNTVLQQYDNNLSTKALMYRYSNTNTTGGADYYFNDNAFNGFNLRKVTNSAGASSSYLPLNFYTPTVGNTGQLLAANNNYSNAAINIPASGFGILANGTDLSLIAGVSSRSILFTAGGYSSSNQIASMKFTTGLNMDRRLQAKQGADVASAAGAITLGGAGNVFEITGTDAITLISSTDYQNGAEITLIFTSTASLTDGTANSGANIGFELAGNANFTASADDTITLVLCEIGGTQRWREKCRSVN